MTYILVWIDYCLEQLDLLLDKLMQGINYLISIDYWFWFFNSTFIIYMYATFFFMRFFIGTGLTIISSFNLRHNLKDYGNIRPYLINTIKLNNKRYLNFFFKYWF